MLFSDSLGKNNEKIAIVLFAIAMLVVGGTLWISAYDIWNQSRLIDARFAIALGGTCFLAAFAASILLMPRKALTKLEISLISMIIIAMTVGYASDVPDAIKTAQAVAFAIGTLLAFIAYEVWILIHFLAMFFLAIVGAI